MRHLTTADYLTMPWANGRGTTVELLREDGPEGLLFRLSMASVIEDGPFSILPGIERNLTVLSGPGFRLQGAGLSLICAPLVPVSFPGDLAARADAGEMDAQWVAEVCLLKNHATQTMQFCADQAVQILGGMGYMRGTQSERIYREVKVMMIGGGAEEIMKELAARQLGL